MTYLKATIFAAATTAATITFAHDGVKNPAVMARMQAMTTISVNMKALAAMTKGQVAFDAGTANAALDVIAQAAATVPGLFEAEEDDPKSAAAAEIWFNWDDFVAKAGALETAAATASISTAADLGPALGSVGGTCKACHTDYKL